MGTASALPLPTAGRPTTARRAALLLLVAAVTLAHLWLTDGWWPQRLGEGAAAHNLPRRIEVAFVRELQPAAPPAAPPRPAQPTLRRLASSPAAAGPSPAASAAQALPAAAQVSALPALPDLQALAPLESLETLQPAPAEEPPAPAAEPERAASAPSAPAFEWPPSTRLSYRLTGWYLGPVEGQAQVEWLRDGRRYQVHLQVSVGPSFAPLVSRRIVSEGEVTPEGLSPRRYDEETRIALRAPRRLSIHLDPDAVRLPNGTQLPRPPGVQDSASQFVQMTWLFTTHPQWLEPGRTVEFALALPRRVETWHYDVVGREPLWMPTGQQVDTVHVRPRREAGRGGDLVAEMWVAPTLQYLPVRILIRQDAENHVDLMLERLPEQASPGR